MEAPFEIAVEVSLVFTFEVGVAVAGTREDEITGKIW